jgi:hypothetical protein
MLAFQRYHLNLAFHNNRRGIDVTTSPAPPFPPSLQIPRSARSTAHANVAEARWLRGHNPLRAATAVYSAAPRGFSAADALAALEDGVANTHGDHAIALRGLILAHRVP